MARTKRRKAKTPRARARKPEAPFQTYANHVTAGWGCTEMNVIFSQTHPTRTPGTIDWPVVEVSRVTIPREAAKTLAFSLLTEIAVYESLLGPVAMAAPLRPAMPTNGSLSAEAIARLAIHY